MTLFDDVFSLRTLFTIVMVIQATVWFGMERGYMRSRVQARNRREKATGSPPFGMSVIVALKNEAEAISGLLERLLDQTVVNYEIVLVDDHSTDASTDLIRTWQDRENRITFVTSAGQGKKAALDTGIRAAQYEVCVFTDADCRPPRTWLARHAMYYKTGQASVVVGHAPLETKGGFLGLVQRFDVELSQLLGAAAIGNRAAYAATGRNLSYSKSLFDEVGGFDRHSHTLSGDDDLLVQDIRLGTNAAIFWDDSPEISVSSPAPTSWRTWLSQKRRHSSDSRQFIRDVKISQSLFYLSYIGFWAMAFIEIELLLLAFPLLLALQVWGMWDGHRFFGKRFSLFWLPILSPWFALYSLVVPITGHVQPPKKWSGR